MIQTILTILNQNSDAIIAGSVVIGGVWAVFKFSEYLKDRRFNNYHRLIKELVDGDTPDATLRLDRQIAVLFELRNYPSYYELSERILIGLQEAEWNQHSKRLGKEIDLTLEYIRKDSLSKIRNWFARHAYDLFIVFGLLLQTKGAVLLSQAVFPTGVETGGADWSTYLTGFNQQMYQVGLHFLIAGFIIQLLPTLFKMIRK